MNQAHWSDRELHETLIPEASFQAKQNDKCRPVTVTFVHFWDIPVGCTRQTAEE